MTHDHSTNPITDERVILPIILVLPITSIGVFMSAMDGSIVNVSLKTIAGILGTDIEGIRWIVVAYLLVITSLMGLSGWLGDKFGRKKIFQLGMVIFTVGSLFCSLSFTLELLILSRVVQAVGAAGLTANGLAIVITYVDPRKRGRAIGLNSLVVAAALSTGPVVGGILTQHFGWQSIFIINIPIGLLGVILTEKFIRETTRSPAERLDIVGIITFALTMFSMVAGVIYFFKADILGILLIGVSAVSGFIFVYTEFHHVSPMISVRVMKNRKILTGAISAFFCYLSINGTFFLLPFYYQDVLGFDQSNTGMLMIVSPIVMSVSGPVTGFLAEKIEAWKLATTGAVTMGSFLMFLAAINPGMSLLSILFLVALGAGSLAIFTNSNGTSVMDAAPEKEISVVSGILNLSRNIAFALGTALSTSLFVLISDFNNPGGYTSGVIWESAYYTGLGTTFAIFAVFALIGAVISISRGRENSRASTGF